MTNGVIQNKIRNIEAELSYLKSVVIDRPDFSIDEKNWNKIKSPLKKTRAKIYKKVYGK
jgi:hypothetical protein